jgi:hypothetical protein
MIALRAHRHPCFADKIDTVGLTNDGIATSTDDKLQSTHY